MKHSCRLLSICLVLCGATACGDDDTPAPDTGTADGGTDGGTDDGGGDPPYELTIETLNVGLAGSFVPNEAARRAPVIEAVAAADADVLCLQEVWLQDDKDMIETAAAMGFPHAVSFTHDLDTVVDDPTDEDGETPEAPTVPPCQEESLATALDEAIACLVENCSTIPDDESGQTTSSACASDSCLSVVSRLALGSTEQLRCYSCITTNLPTETFTDMRTQCTTEVNANLAFRGQSGVMILSKHPVSNAEAFVMPGTWNRRIVAEATVTLPNEAEIDVYCNHLTPIFEGLAFPYTGQYSGGGFGGDAWGGEQLLQANKLRARVTARSGTDRPGFILGDFNTGVEDEANMLNDEFPDTFEYLDAEFTNAIPSDFTPSCTFCSDNGNIGVDDGTGVWIDHIFMTNLPAEAVVSAEVSFDEDVVDVDGTLVPLSDHYGFRSVVEIPTP